MLLIFVLLCTSLAIAQSDNLCFGCFPDEPITAENVSHLSITSGLEGYFYLVSIAGDSQSVAVVTGDQQSKPSFSANIIRPLLQKSEEVNNVVKEDLYWASLHNITQSKDLTQIAYQPQGKWLAVGYQDGKIEFWDAMESNLEHTSWGKGKVEKMVYHPDGLGVITIEDAHFIGWHDLIDNGEYFEVADREEMIYSIAISYDGLWLAAGTETGVLIYNTRDFSLVADILLSKSINTIAFDRIDSHKLFVLTDKVSLWKWELSPTDIRQIEVFKELAPQSLEFIGVKKENDQEYHFVDSSISPDSTVLVALDTLGCLRTWIFRQEQWKEIVTEPGNTGCESNPIYDVEFSPDGLWLMLGRILFQTWAVP